MKTFFGEVEDLCWLEDGRGRLMEILRGRPDFEFGQAYVTTCRPGVVKAWHHHARQMDRMVCLSGSLQIGLFSESQDRVATVYSTDRNPRLVTINPGIWHGFSSVGGTEAIVLNIPDRAYNREFPDEQRRSPYDKNIPYEWGIKDG